MPPDPKAETPDAPLPPVKLDPLAALFSYLVPGLGQVYQGRVGKGLLFFFGLYGLFFYGMWMGQWRNVWLPDPDPLPATGLFGQQFEGLPKALAYRSQFLGQFWIGAAAWPAVYQYATYDPREPAGGAFGTFQRVPSEDELNDLQRNGSKRWDLGWVYTVIAGVLNLLVIYDAFAGPLFRDPPAWAEDPDGGEALPPPAQDAGAPQAAPPPGQQMPAGQPIPPDQMVQSNPAPNQGGAQ